MGLWKGSDPAEAGGKRRGRAAWGLLWGLLLLAALPLPARAAGVHMGFSDPTAAVGDAVSVVVLATAEGSDTAEALSRVELTLRYEEETLQYESFSGGLGSLQLTAESGRLILSDATAREGGAVFLVELHFTARAAGGSSITIERCQVWDAQGEEAECSFGSAAVDIREKIDQDVKLRVLSVGEGELEPAFRPECTRYTLTVPYETTAITVTARPNNYWASAYVDGHASLQVGENTVNITVTSGDGSTQRLYTVLVTRMPAVTPTPEPTPVVVPSVELPEETEVEIEGEVEAAPEPEPTVDVEAIRAEAYGEGLAVGEAEGEALRAALQSAQQRLETLERAAKAITLAAIAEVLVIAALGGILWKKWRGE